MRTLLRSRLAPDTILNRNRTQSIYQGNLLGSSKLRRRGTNNVGFVAAELYPVRHNNELYVNACLGGYEVPNLAGKRARVNYGLECSLLPDARPSRDEIVFCGAQTVTGKGFVALLEHAVG